MIIEILRLKMKGTDYTYDQGRSVSTCIQNYHKGLPAWCFDLSAATDRLPLSLEAKVLECCGLSKLGSDAWKFIMTGIPFFSIQYNNYVRYTVGQGIGAYSS
jgi:hypothetical protein